MKSLEQIVDLNDRAVLREYIAAMEDGDVALAGRIAMANPDLFPGRTPTMRVQVQTESK